MPSKFSLTTHFSDQTAKRIHGAPYKGQDKKDAGSYWIKRTWVFEQGGVPNIATETGGDLTAPSEVFTNDGTRHFSLAGTFTGESIAAVCTIGNRTTLIETNDETVSLVPYP
jgi:hypothetical protein